MNSISLDLSYLGTKFKKKVITEESILAIYRESTPTIARRICFETTHKTALKANSLSLPFSETIEPLYEIETKLSLRRKDNYYVYFNGDKSKFDRTKMFIDTYKSRVFLRDCLDLSMALAENWVEGQINSRRTLIGEIEYQAKYSKNESVEQANTILLSQELENFINQTSFYRSADYICAVPPSRSKEEYNLPRNIVAQTKNISLKNISPNIKWENYKGDLKDTSSYKEKLEILKKANLLIDCDVENKSIVLVDDLYKSGVTMQYIALKLKEAGASRVFGIATVKSASN